MNWFINIINKIRQKYWEVTNCNPPYDCPFCMHCYDKYLLKETKEESEIVENYIKENSIRLK